MALYHFGPLISGEMIFGLGYFCLFTMGWKKQVSFVI
jgi:hypothetical protein